MSKKGGRTFLPKEASSYKGYKVFPCDVVGETMNRMYRLGRVENKKAFTHDRGVYVGPMPKFDRTPYSVALCSLGHVALLP